ncbi:MAG: hypothetical protein WD904_04125 [Dehalococcoidia bacterium]
MRTLACLVVALAAVSVAATGISFQGNSALATRALPPGAESNAHRSDGANDVGVNYVSLNWPSAANISDTNGRYMWVVAQIENFSDETEMVKVGMTIAEGVPTGCERGITLVMPGQTSMLIYAGESKTMVWRVRYECHSPAVMSVVRQTVTVGITHCDPATSEPGPVTEPTPGGVCRVNDQPVGSEGDVSNNAVTVSRSVLIK